VAANNRAIRQSAKAATQRPAAEKSFTMRHLWRMTLWAGAAAGALFLAVLSSRSEVGAQRLATALPSWTGHEKVRVATHSSDAKQSFDAQAETRRLEAALRDLSAENGELRSRLAEVERHVDDMTGSVSRQIAAVKAETAPAWPADARPAPLTPAQIASIVSPADPGQAAPGGVGAPLATPPRTTPAKEPTAPAPAAAAPAGQYAVDIGSAPTLQMLRARWVGLRSAHPQLFQGLTPSVTLHEAPQSRRVDLRLVAGPLPSAEAAVRLCAALVPFRLFCQPTMLDRRRVALQ
jgi:hypothetical protein